MNTKNRARGLYWFRNDCRLTDMPALNDLARQVDRLLCVYVVESDWFNQNRWHCKAMGEHRWRFINQGLSDLSVALEEKGNQLLVVEGDAAQVIFQLINENQITHLGVADHCGTHEQNQLVALRCAFPNLTVLLNQANNLFTEGDFPFSLENMPDTFSPFRRKVEKYAEVQKPCEPIDTLPPSIHLDAIQNDNLKVTRNYKIPNNINNKNLIGGESAALSQLRYYLFDSDHIAQYKETRNGMLGWDYSSKLSAWLAAGHVSPRLVASELNRYESERIKNDSTYWLFFELLWREFFYWQMKKDGTALFHFQGIQGKRPNTRFDMNTFTAWQNGETGYDIVDACMKELNATGFMSNRGRQLVASCFVHELNLDWRYGAAYFEQQLIDFDVASNYGNWQYLAGVGSDPRGHRQFNLDKQTQQYDGNAQFRNLWLT